MIKKQNLISKNIVVFFLCFLMIFIALTKPMETYAETRVEPNGYIKFAKLGVDKLSGGLGYLKLNLGSYGINMTTDGNFATTKGTNKYDVVTTSSISRVSYQRKLEVAYGTTLSLAGGVADTGLGGADAAVNKIVWNVMEWDRNGLLISDSGWLYTDQSYVVGKSPDVSAWSTSNYWGPMKRTDVAYITLIFRRLNVGDSLQNGTGMNVSMSVSELMNMFPNMYLCYAPFTYTVKNESGGTLATLNRIGVADISLENYMPVEKEGYTSGFKITSSSSLTPNWMNGNIYTPSQINTWLNNGRFYNSLFGNVTLTQVYTPNIYTVSYNANGGTTSATSQSVAYGGAVDLSPIASKNGYTFIGWSTSNTSRIPLSSYNMPAGNVTLYAVYSMEVSDVENHDYPGYAETPNISNDEVFLKVWIKNTTTCKYYPLIYSQDVTTLVYRYVLPTTDISNFTNGREYAFQLIAYDNAGNEAILYDGSGGTPVPPEPKKYIQKVYHYKYHPLSNTQVLFAISNTDVVEGNTFEPSYVTPPAGYHASSKDAGKTVVATNTYNAYYHPNTYTVTYDANGGNVTPAAQTVIYDNYYPALPIPTRTGYTFLGWSTASNGTGIMVKNGDVYTIDGNQTLYAQWKANVYEIKLDAQDATSTGTKAYYEKYDVGNFATSDCINGISVITAPNKTGYTFGGYYDDRGGHGMQYVAASGNILSSQTAFSENTTLYAKWTANTYTVRYHANGGIGDMAEMVVTYDSTVNLSSNLFERTGYTFAGWSTTADGIVNYADKQSITNLTDTDGVVIDLYAVWDINSYTVTYDYWTNGGKGAETDSATIKYNAPVDLKVSAEKGNGFTFVGWNTDASATTGLVSLSMGTENLTLYAIYEKTIHVTFVERNEENVIETILSKTIYNNENQADFYVEEKGILPGWRKNGWSDKKEATAEAVTSTGATYTASDSINLYALYVSDVTVSYDTNGAGIEYDSAAMERFHNASGDDWYPVFKIEPAPEFSNHSFVMWKGVDGAVYDEAELVEIKESTVLTALWDQFPAIEAYDRYFTLEQAQNGFITQWELLSKVIGTDREDGKLVNGTEVIVKDYDAKLFAEITEDTDIEIVYQAKDDFENIVTKQITVGIRDTSMKEGTKKYVRFIGRDFLEDEDGKLLSEEAGGLEKTSIWRRDESYLSLLRNVLSKVVPEKETISFTADELKKLKEMSPAN